MYFDNYAHGNIRIEPRKLLTGKNPKTALVWIDRKGARVKDDDGNDFLLSFNARQNLFIVTNPGYVHTDIFKEIDEEGNLVMESGVTIDPKQVVFIGKSKNY